MIRYLKRAAAFIATSWLLSFGRAAASAAEAPCDRVCLKGFIDQYVEALDHHDPSRLSVAADARFTQNGAQVPLGEALWVTFGMRMPDENLAGEAWKFRDGKITRVESTFLGNNVYRAGTGRAGGMQGVSRPIGQ
jgi:hypothetical protein